MASLRHILSGSTISSGDETTVSIDPPGLFVRAITVLVLCPRLDLFLRCSALGGPNPNFNPISCEGDT